MVDSNTNASLEGVRVLTLEHGLVGPWTTQQLGDLGAEIFKIEPPEHGDYLREFGPFVGDRSAYFFLVNRNKESVALDVSTKEGAEIFKQIVDDFDIDVVVQNFRVGKVQDFGIGYEDIREIQDDIIYCSVSGFGQDGPNSHLTGVDSVAQAFSGMMSVNGPADEEYMRIGGVAAGGTSATMYAVQSILNALYHRERTGEGQHIDVALADCLFSWTLPVIHLPMVTGELPPKGGNPFGWYPFKKFETKDKPVYIQAIRDYWWKSFCQAIEDLGGPDFYNDDRFETHEDRLENLDQIDPKICSLFEEKTMREVLDTMAEHGVPAGPYNDMKSVLESEQVTGRDLLHDVDFDGESFKLLEYPVKSSETTTTIRKTAPEQGEHTEAILNRLGYDEESITQLRDGEVIE